ncbi:MAG: hypothetical protein Q9181_004220 [Wetmoreana brouardii]
MIRIFVSAILLAITYVAIAVESGNGGDGPSDDAACQTYASCGPPGLRIWNTMQTTLMQQNPVDRTDGLARFQNYYGVQLSRVPYLAGFAIRGDLVGHGFDPKLLDSWETVSRARPRAAPDPWAAAYNNGFDTKNGLLVAYSNNRTRDSVPALNQLPWSELMYQTWKVIQTQQKGGPISNLRTVVRQGVTTPGTLEVLKTMYKSRQLTTDQGDQKWYQWTEANQREFFFALLGTDNVKGVLWLLNDHAAEIGKKEITEIWTRWTEPANPDIWIEIAPADWLNFMEPPATQ